MSFVIFHSFHPYLGRGYWKGLRWSPPWRSGVSAHSSILAVVSLCPLPPREQPGAVKTDLEEVGWGATGG